MSDFEIVYNNEPRLDPEEFLAVLIDSTLGERRPIGEKDRIIKMCENASLVVTARHKGKLVGVARALTDFTYCTYLSDLAVSVAYQKRGIGKELIRRVKEAIPEATLLLLSAPKAMDYYPKIGLTRHEGAFILKDVGDLKK
jgi:ribosomal protein S18 acetylase RimI-like enzyme